MNSQPTPATAQDLERRMRAVRESLDGIDRKISDAIGEESQAREALREAVLAAALDPDKAPAEQTAHDAYRAASEKSSTVQARRDALVQADKDLLVKWQAAVERERHGDAALIKARMEEVLPVTIDALIAAMARVRLLHEARGGLVGRGADLLQAIARQRPSLDREIVRAAEALKATILSKPNGKV